MDGIRSSTESSSARDYNARTSLRQAIKGFTHLFIADAHEDLISRAGQERIIDVRHDQQLRLRAALLQRVELDRRVARDDARSVAQSNT